MRISSKIFLFILFGCQQSIWTQEFENITFEVESFSMPFAGGINNPQFSSIDFNRDEFSDLLVFDRACNCINIFENLGQPNVSQYILRPKWRESFPNLKNWVVLKDFNSDGLPDIFSYSDIPGIDGIIVYRGIPSSDSILFERMNVHPTFNLIHYQQPSGALTPLYVSKIDYPAIEDVDCDGDIDIVTFNSGGGVIEFYKNLAVERGFDLDTLLFERADRCWGGLYESGISETIDLSAFPGECFENIALPEEILPRHAGSTLLVVDANGDQLKDLFLGDISFGNLSLLTNAGDCGTAWFNQQQIYYPESDEPVEINIFPIAFHLDLNNDGLMDLVVASNDRYNGDDLQNIWWYKGTEQNFLSSPQLQNKSFLIEEMIDLGRNSSIVVEDVTGDGLKDFIIAGDLKLKDNIYSRLFLFENIGDQVIPKFKLVEDDYLGLGNFNFTSTLAPSFGDIDGDGVVDVVIGEESGSLFFGKGTLNDEGVLKVNDWQFPFEDIDVGNYSQPFIFDFNKDGFGDLFVGEQTGNINYFQNTGEVDNWFANPIDQLPNSSYFGNIDTRFPGYFFGFSSPFIFENEEGVHLITGSEAGYFKHYLSPSASHQFTEILDEVTSIQAGIRTTPFLADINDDGYLELFTGNFRGGALIYTTSFFSQNSVAIEEKIPSGFTIFPNPSPGIIQLKGEIPIQEHVSILVFDLKGRIISRQKNFNPHADQIFIPSKGVYLVQVMIGQELYFAQKVLVY